MEQVVVQGLLELSLTVIATEAGEQAPGCRYSKASTFAAQKGRHTVRKQKHRTGQWNKASTQHAEIGIAIANVSLRKTQKHPQIC